MLNMRGAVPLVKQKGNQSVMIIIELCIIMVPSHNNSSPKQHDLQPGKKKKASQLAEILATPSHAIESVVISCLLAELEPAVRLY